MDLLAHITGNSSGISNVGRVDAEAWNFIPRNSISLCFSQLYHLQWWVCPHVAPLNVAEVYSPNHHILVPYHTKQVVPSSFLGGSKKAFIHSSQQPSHISLARG